ncbi:MAG: PD-(D/E)XK nuclease family protein [Candidatus Eisenbacteria bacterium]
MPPEPRTPLLLTGRPGSGKTEQIIDRFLAGGGDLPGRGVLALLPDRGGAAELRRRIAARAGERGFVDTGLLTFEDVAARVLGVPRSGLTSPETESLLLLALEDRLPREIGARVRSPRFRSAFLGWVADLREAGIGAKEVRALLGALPEPDRRLDLLADTLDVFLGAEEERGYLSAARLPLLAARAIESGRAPFPPPPLLLVDGFHHFSAARLELLGALAGRAGETVITLPDPNPDDAWTGGALKRALSAITERFSVEEVSLPGGYDLPPPEFFGGADRREEMDRVARTIRCSIAEDGRSPRDFLVLFRDVTPYRRVAESAFRRAGVPFEGRFQAEAAATAPGRSLLDLVRVLREGVCRETVEGILKNRMFDTGADLADRVVNAWKGKPASGSAEALLEETAAETPGFATERIEPLLRFAREARGASPPEGARRLREFWIEWIEPSLREGAFPPEEDALVGAAVARLADLLEGIAAAAEEEPVLAGGRGGDFFGLVEEEIRRTRVTYAAGRKGGVRIDDYRHGQNLRAPVLFLPGLESSLVPRPYQPGAFWTESDREKLGSGGQFRVPGRASHADEERYLFRRAYSRGTERVILTAPTFDPGGGASSESPFRQEIRMEFGEASPGDGGAVERFTDPSSVVVPDDLLPYLASRSDPAEGDRAGVGLAARLLLALSYPVPTPPRDFKEPVRLGETALFAAWKRGREEFTISELEDYRACPYRYFAHYLLGLREPPGSTEFGLDALAEGQVAHKVLEGVEAGEGTAEELVEKIMAETRGAFGERVGHRLLLAELRENLTALLEKDRAFRRNRGWRVEAFEYDFGEAEGAPVFLAPDVRIRGRIDRIDFGPKDLALVIDYKRSARGRRDVERALADGRSLALPLYAVAVREALGRRPAGALLLAVKKARRGGFFDESLAPEGVVPEGKDEIDAALPLSGEDFRLTLERAVEVSLETVGEIRGGSFPVQPADDKVCDRLGCPFRDLCRVVLAARDGEEEPGEDE